MAQLLSTAWHGADMVVTRSGIEIDRVATQDIERVILVCRRGGATPGDLAYAIIETPSDHLLLPASSGIAGRVHFERQAMWTDKACIYWVDESSAKLPRRVRPGFWLLRSKVPVYQRLSRGQLDPAIGEWPLEGPQTWEQRKWQRIVRSRPLAVAHASAKL